MADTTLHIEIVSPEGIIFEGDGDELIVPTIQGEIAILPHHTALFTRLIEGEAFVKKAGKIISYALTGGFLEVQQNKASILSDFVIPAESIEIAKVQAAKKRAEEILAGKIANEDFTLAQKDLERAILSLKIAEKVRRRH